MRATDCARLAVALVSRSGHCREVALALERNGAELIHVTGRSDVAHARCLAAGRLLATDREWLAWLDDDVDAPLDNFLDSWSEAEAYRARGIEAAIAGRYVSRLNPLTYAARRIEHPGPTLAHPDVYAGMGAFVYHREALQAVAAKVPTIEPLATGASVDPYPAAFATGPQQDQQGRWVWGPEDFCHCAYLNAVGVRVLYSRRCYAHGHRWPSVWTKLLGSEGEAVDDDPGVVFESSH